MRADPPVVFWAHSMEDERKVSWVIEKVGASADKSRAPAEQGHQIKVCF